MVGKDLVSVTGLGQFSLLVDVVFVSLSPLKKRKEINRLFTFTGTIVKEVI